MKIKNIFIPVLNAFFVSLLILILNFAGTFDFLELKSYDSRINYFSKYRNVCDDVLFIMVDQNSINKANEKYGWNWPWPREAYGKIYNYLDEGNALTCTFDILWTEQSVYGKSDDEKFASYLLNGKNTKSVVAKFWNGSETDSLILNPIEVIGNAADFIANTTSKKDSDGIIRRTRVTDKINDEEFVYMGFAPILLEGKEINHLSLEKDNTLKLNYKGSIDRYAHYSAIDILESIDEKAAGRIPEFDCENFEGAHVFVIYYAPGIFDICSTPIGKFYPGAGVPITVVDNYLTDSFLKTLPNYLCILCIILCAIIGTALSWILEKMNLNTGSLILKFVLFFTGLFFIILLNYILFYFEIHAIIIALVFSYLVSYWTMTVLQYFIEGKQKKFIKNAFGQYLSPAVISQLIQNPEKLKLGGEKRNISIFFSDVQSFTTLSETLSPEKLTDLLNIYLSEMSKIILESGGTIDKYEGDAIIAFWNAPAEILNHQKCALDAAIKCQEKLKEMELYFIEKVGRPMWTRIGINSGDAVVGNMGSENRFDYTMFGDSVNLASRLEGINKQFGTYILCSEATKKSAEESGSSLYFREIANVQVVGKTTGVRVFEPMTKEKFLENKSEIELFEAGLKNFYKGKFSEAKNIFEKNSNDEASKKYLKKCDELILKYGTSCDDFNGIWVAESK